MAWFKLCMGILKNHRVFLETLNYNWRIDGTEQVSRGMIKVRTRYFGKIRELLGVKTEEYDVKEEATLADLLLTHIPERHKKASKAWNEMIFRTVKGERLLNKDGTPILKNYLILIDGKTSSLKQKLKEGDEIAVLPPFGGG